MWDTPFDVAMLDHGDVIIHCPSEELAYELFCVFSENGLHWDATESMNNTNWTRYKEATCYRITSKHAIKYGDKVFYSDSDYDYYTRCTFYGIETPDFDIASGDELLALLEIGGG